MKNFFLPRAAEKISHGKFIYFPGSFYTVRFRSSKEVYNKFRGVHKTPAPDLVTAHSLGMLALEKDLFLHLVFSKLTLCHILPVQKDW